jgi:hypothetical protein
VWLDPVVGPVHDEKRAGEALEHCDGFGRT